MADYKGVSQSASEEQTPADDIDHKVVNKIVSNVFLMVTVQLAVYYVGIFYLMSLSATVLELIAMDYYHTALLTFIATSFVFIYTRKYHRSFPRNLLYVPLPVGGLGVIFLVQLVRFGLDAASRSDVPALLFLLLTCALFAIATRNPFFPYKCWWRSSGIFLILTLLVASGVVQSFRLYEDFRYLSLIIVSVSLLYLVTRIRVLVLNKGFSTTASDAVHVYLDILVVPLAVVSGPITFAYFYVMPHSYGPWIAREKELWKLDSS